MKSSLNSAEFDSSNIITSTVKIKYWINKKPHTLSLHDYIDSRIKEALKAAFKTKTVTERTYSATSSNYKMWSSLQNPSVSGTKDKAKLSPLPQTHSVVTGLNSSTPKSTTVVVKNNSKKWWG